MSDRRKKTMVDERSTETETAETPEGEAVVAEEQSPVSEAPADEAVEAEDAGTPRGQVENGDVPEQPEAPERTEAAPHSDDVQTEPGEGETKVVYRGLADTFEHDGRVYRPGKAAIVPTDVAEDLLTYPNEQFERVEE